MEAIPAGRLFALDQQMFISIMIQLFNVCVLAAALSYILYRPVSNFIRRRADRIRTQLDHAKEDMIKASKLKAQYEKRLENIELERAEILESARQFADKNSRRILEEAKKEATALRKRATEDIERELERASEDMKLYIIEVSSIIAGKFVADAIDGDTQDRLFAEAIAELENSAWLN